MFARAGTSDPVVFRQIFIEREYDCLADLRALGLVIDCGANVGYSSIYFLNRYPGCELVAIEPDPGNFAALARNMAPYANRVRLVQAGLWSHPTRLALRPNGYRDGLEWSRQVREAEPGDEDTIDAVDIPTILARVGHERVSLLKVDIEGAEAVVFGPGSTGWLERVDNVVIELHDDTPFGPASDVVRAALAEHAFVRSTSGELAVFKRRSSVPVAARQQQGS